MMDDVADSPFVVLVQDDPRVAVRGRGIESVPINEPTEFTVDASRALFAASPVVLITGIHCCC